MLVAEAVLGDLGRLSQIQRRSARGGSCDERSADWNVDGERWACQEMGDTGRAAGVDLSMSLYR